MSRKKDSVKVVGFAFHPVGRGKNIRNRLYGWIICGNKGFYPDPLIPVKIMHVIDNAKRKFLFRVVDPAKGCQEMK